MTVLVYGYGNPGRGDDGLGIALADAIERRALPGVTVQRNYQLNLEDALLLTEFEATVFVDASRDLSPRGPGEGHEATVFVDASRDLSPREPGEGPQSPPRRYPSGEAGRSPREPDFRLRPLEPAADRGFTTHSLHPAAVLALCTELYGKRPPTYLLELAGHDWDLHEGLSDLAQASLAAGLELLTSLLTRSDPLAALAAAAQ
jgi:hypothetical protein